MKRTTQILLFLFILTSCQSNKEDNFNTFIGSEKSQVIELSNDHFNNFLEVNFKGESDLERTIQFLDYIATSTDFRPNWKIDLTSAKDILEKYEVSGLRKDFELYGYEKPDSVFYYDMDMDTSSILDSSTLETIDIELEEEEMIPISGRDSGELMRIEEEQKRKWDSTLNFHIYGRYIFGLKKFYSKDSIVLGYINYRDFAYNAPLGILASGLKKELENRQELTEGTRLIILFEFYLPYLRNEIKTLDQQQ